MRSCRAGEWSSRCKRSSLSALARTSISTPSAPVLRRSIVIPAMYEVLNLDDRKSTNFCNLRSLYGGGLVTMGSRGDDEIVLRVVVHLALNPLGYPRTIRLAGNLVESVQQDEASPTPQSLLEPSLWSSNRASPRSSGAMQLVTPLDCW